MKPFASTRSLASVKGRMFYRVEEYPVHAVSVFLGSWEGEEC
jgi:hypothetical protein